MTWVLIDISFLAHRARYALGDLDNADMPTGILFAIFEQIRTICQHPKIDSNKICVFFDSKKSYRKKVYPEYKAKRKEKTEDEREQIDLMHTQVNLLREIILPEMGVSVYRQTGLESDDLMAKACLQFYNAKRQAVIVTSDKDLCQCIRPSVHWFDPAREVYHTSKSFINNYGIDAEQWKYVKMLAGCVSDNVQGIAGVGEVTAIKYLNDYLPEHYKTYRSITSKEGIRIRKRNIELVVLPHTKTKEVKLKEPDYNPEAFFATCARYGITAYLKKGAQQEWNAFFDPNYKIKTRRRGE